MRLGTPSEKSLAPYRKHLPASEFAALDAWISQFYPYQLTWLLDPARLAICNKARQIGLSHTVSALGCIWGAFHGELTTIISKGQEESQEVLSYARKHAKVLGQLGSRAALLTKDRAIEIQFASGGRIRALPNTGGRGFSGNAVLDEHAYHPHPDDSWDATVPSTTLGYKLRVISTPNGVANKFAELWAKAKQSGSRWSAHEIPIETAIAQGFPVNIEDCWDNANGDPRLFDQIYRCKFLDNELQYIPSDLFSLVFKERPDSGAGLCYAGLDIGETRDRTVLTIVRRSGDERRLVHIESHKLTDDDLLEQLVAKALGAPYNCKRVAIDETGMGTFPTGRMKRKYGSRIEPIWFTSDVKEELATALYDVVQTERLTIPRSYVFNGTDEIPQLREDVYAIKRIVTTAGNVRFDASRTSKGHADRAWSLMLAVHAAGTMSRMFAALGGGKR